MAELLYAAIVDGRVVAVEDDISVAISEAEAVSDSPVVVEEVPDVRRNPGDDVTPAHKMAAMAFQETGLPQLHADKVMRLSIQEAHAILKPYFQLSRPRQGVIQRVGAYDKPAGLVKAILGQNYKTAKQKPGEKPSDVQGLSVVPHGLAHDSKLQGVLRRAGGLVTVPSQHKGFCKGSNNACREGCLVYSGQNGADPYNAVIKMARTTALLNEPVAFARVLVAATARHYENAPDKGFVPFIRMNVFSDIPWEIAFPDLFEMFPRMQFYDYTKVAGRRPPRNYDLTFSFSGTNKKLVEHEIRDGRRVAVVFLPTKEGKRLGRHADDWKAPFAGKLWGLPIVDGDESDLRPLDPAPSIVGLRWKTPMGKGVDPTQSSIGAFVTPCYLEEGRLIAAAAARQEPIVDADDGIEETIG